MSGQAFHGVCTPFRGPHRFATLPFGCLTVLLIKHSPKKTKKKHQETHQTCSTTGLNGGGTTLCSCTSARTAAPCFHDSCTLHTRTTKRSSGLEAIAIFILCCLCLCFLLVVCLTNTCYMRLLGDILRFPRHLASTALLYSSPRAHHALKRKTSTALWGVKCRKPWPQRWELFSGSDLGRTAPAQPACLAAAQPNLAHLAA